jgi:hypothetical protein
VRTVYAQIWAVLKLKHVQSILFMYIFAKVGFAVNDAAFSLKLVERGLGKEDLAIAVLIDFPFQIFGGWIAARYSTGDKPLRPWVRRGSWSAKGALRADARAHSCSRSGRALRSASSAWACSTGSLRRPFRPRSSST